MVSVEASVVDHSVMVSFSPSFLTVQWVLFPITPIQLHLYCIKFTKELGTTLTTRLGISYGDMMGLGREELGFGSRVLSGLALPLDMQVPCTCFDVTLNMLNNDPDSETNLFLPGGT